MDALISTFGVDWHLLLAQAVNFGILVAALTWLLYKPVLKAIRERETLINQGVEDAERAKEKLQGADTEGKKIVEKAETEAEGLVASARETANTERARILKEAEARAAAVAKDAHMRAEENAAKALRDSEKEIARLAVLAAEKVLKEKA